MKIAPLIEFFIHPSYKDTPGAHRKARLFVRASLLTSLFSNSYIWLSLFFEYQRGVNLMIFNVAGFLALAFLAKTKISLKLLGNLYVLVGAVAVITLTYYSGGMWSAIYPWIISIPVLALLVVDKTSGIFWGILSYVVMMWFGIQSLNGYEFPLEYNVEMRTLWFVSVVPGLLLIVMLVSLVFEGVQAKALINLETKNEQLEDQKATISSQAVELERLIEDKDHIIRILAHDLKNPLANITTISNLVEKETDPEKQKEYIAMIDRVSSNAQSLVNRVVEMARLDQGNLKLSVEAIDVTEELEKVIADSIEVAHSKEIIINLRSEATRFEVSADKTYFQQIFENLISNAVKFSQKNTTVEVVVSNTDTHVHVKVIDEGPGIDPREEDRLFKKFSKLSTKPTAGESSTGLGLSLTKQYVEQINGQVWYENTVKVGSTFVVELPLV